MKCVPEMRGAPSIDCFDGFKTMRSSLDQAFMAGGRTARGDNRNGGHDHFGGRDGQQAPKQTVITSHDLSDEFPDPFHSKLPQRVGEGNIAGEYRRKQ